jgi:hypothetical protein
MEAQVSAMRRAQVMFQASVVVSEPARAHAASVILTGCSAGAGLSPGGKSIWY